MHATSKPNAPVKQLAVIRIEVLQDNKGNPLLVTMSGCYLDDDGKTVNYPDSDSPCGTVEEAEHRVQYLRKMGYEFQLVKISSTI